MEKNREYKKEKVANKFIEKMSAYRIPFVSTNAPSLSFPMLKRFIFLFLFFDKW
jgi:hypothetical protein